MARKQGRHRFPRLEILEARLQLSGAVPANSIGTALGAVQRPGAVQRGECNGRREEPHGRQVVDALRRFRQPGSGSELDPRIVGVKESDGRSLSIKQGRPFVAGRADGQAAVFVKVSASRSAHRARERRPPFRWGVLGRRHVAGDANGDGTVNQADLAAFAAAYLSTPGDQNYNAAADFNQDGIVNQVDAKALEQNMPAAKRRPLALVMNLSPADQAQGPTPQNSGGATFRQDVTVVGRTLPGSIVIQDGTSGYYKWTGPAYATNSSGVFTAPEKLTEGINTFNFLVIDPFGRQLIRTYPDFLAAVRGFGVETEMMRE